MTSRELSTVGHCEALYRSSQSSFQHFPLTGVVHKPQPLAEKILGVDLGGCWERDGHISLEEWPHSDWLNTYAHMGFGLDSVGCQK